MKSEQAGRAGPASVDDYIDSFPVPVRKVLKQMRSTIRAAAPGATERISYRMPTFDLLGPVVYFAGFKTHIGLYPVPRAHPDFKKELARYKGGKGTAQFSLEAKLPVGLIRRIVQFRVRENKRRAQAKTR